jgi:hypothetical protein
MKRRLLAFSVALFVVLGGVPAWAVTPTEDELGPAFVPPSACGERLSTRRGDGLLSRRSHFPTASASSPRSPPLLVSPRLASLYAVAIVSSGSRAERRAGVRASPQDRPEPEDKGPGRDSIGAGSRRTRTLARTHGWELEILEWLFDDRLDELGPVDSPSPGNAVSAVVDDLIALAAHGPQVVEGDLTGARTTPRGDDSAPRNDVELRLRVHLEPFVAR